MAAARRRVVTPTTLQQLEYWRGIRLDNPGRKDEAMRNIDNLLDEWLQEMTVNDGA